MKYYSYLLACLMAFFVISCGSDDDTTGSNQSIPGAENAQYNGADFIALYHGTPQVLASIATGGKVEMDKWNELFSLFTEAPKTRGIIGQSVALVQFAGKMTVVAKDANMDIYTRLKSMGVSYKEMFNQVEPNHRSGYNNAEEWELAMNQGKITSPYCFSDLATAYALKLEDGPGYNYYRYKILANSSVVLAEEGVNVIASFDSDISNAKTAFDFVNSVGTGDYETFSSKVSGIIDGTGGDISDASLYAYKTYLDYCLSNRETSFSWYPTSKYFGDSWYEKIDDETEYEYDILDEGEISNELTTRKKWKAGEEEPLSTTHVYTTIYFGKENYILYLKENDKTVPYRIVNTAGDYCFSEDAFFYMIQVGGTKKRLWRRRPYYPHEKLEVNIPTGVFSAALYVSGNENSLVKDQNGTIYLHDSNFNGSTIYISGEAILKDSKVTYSGDDAIITLNNTADKDFQEKFSLTVKNYKTPEKSYISYCSAFNYKKFRETYTSYSSEETETKDFTIVNIPFKKVGVLGLEYEVTQTDGIPSDYITNYKLFDTSHTSSKEYGDISDTRNYSIPKAPLNWKIRITLHCSKAK